MSSSPARVPGAWILVAHVLGACAIGLLEAVRLRSGALAMVLLSVFACAGALAGGVIAGSERLAQGRRPLVAAAIRAVPTLIVVVPVAWTLFDGAYAQTLPLARAMPLLLPLVVWIVVAVVLYVFHRWFATGYRLKS